MADQGELLRADWWLAHRHVRILLEDLATINPSQSVNTLSQKVEALRERAKALIADADKPEHPRISKITPYINAWGILAYHGLDFEQPYNPAELYSSAEESVRIMAKPPTEVRVHGDNPAEVKSANVLIRDMGTEEILTVRGSARSLVCDRRTVEQIIKAKGLQNQYFLISTFEPLTSIAPDGW